MTVSRGGLPADWALPAITPFNRPWFTSGALTVQQCATCGALQHPPEEICHQCGGMTFAERVLAPAGTVHSYTIAHHSANPRLDGVVPYAVVLVALDEAPQVRVVGNLVDVPVEEVAIGMPVTATWEELGSDDGETVLLPLWQRARAAGNERDEED